MAAVAARVVTADAHAILPAPGIQVKQRAMALGADPVSGRDLSACHATPNVPHYDLPLAPIGRPRPS